MAIRITCTGCQKSLNAPDAARGKAVRCPACQTKISVPADAPVHQKSAPGGNLEGLPANVTGAQKTITGAQKSVTGSQKAVTGAQRAVSNPPTGAEGTAATGQGSSVRKTGSQKSLSQKMPVPGQEALGESREFLLNVNLRDAEDKRVRVCVKCGAPLSEEADVCSKCGVDQATGEVPVSNRPKGPDPAQYYRTLFSESWQFTRRNMSLVGRTTLYSTVGIIAALILGYIYLWCYNLPPKAFDGGLMLLTVFIVMGWTWHLGVEVITAALSRKVNKGALRIHFDSFACAALGLKFVLWHLIFLFPSLLVGGIAWWVLSRSGQSTAGTIVFFGLNGVFYLMFPLSMGHFAMPVQQRGWIMPLMVPIFFRLIGPTLFWWMFVLLVNVPLVASFVAVETLYGPTIRETMGKLEDRNEVLRKQAAERANSKSYTDEGAPPMPDMTAVFYASACLVGCAVYWGFSSVMSVRALSMFVYYFKKPLELVAETPEQVYVPKSLDPTREVQPISFPVTKGLIIAGCLSFLPVIGVVLGYVFGVYLERSLGTSYYKYLEAFFGVGNAPSETAMKYVFAGMGLVFFASVQFATAGRWLAFQKFGEPGWASIIPVYNGMTVLKMAGWEPKWFATLVFPWIRKQVMEDIAVKFEQDKQVGLGLMVFPFAYWPMIGWGKAKHKECFYPKARKKAAKASDGEEGEEESESGEDHE